MKLLIKGLPMKFLVPNRISSHITILLLLFNHNVLMKFAKTTMKMQTVNLMLCRYASQ